LDLPADAGEAGVVPRDDHELPRPSRLILTAGWNLAEALGLPFAGYLVGAMLGGRDVGMVAATGVIWLTVAVRKVATGSVPGLLFISALVPRPRRLRFAGRCVCRRPSAGWG
jgi:hypothetical protein